MAIKMVLGQLIDTKNLEKDWTNQQIEKELSNFQVSHWGFEDTSKDDNDSNDNNLGVRANGTPVVDPLQIDFKTNGWDPTQKPPVKDLKTGSLLDGRTRKVNLKAMDERWMPCVYGTLKDISKPNTKFRATSFAANLHKYAQQHSKEDFKTSLIADIKDGEMIFDRKNPETAKQIIRNHLIKEYSIYKFFKEESNAVGHIVNLAFEESDDNASILIIKDRELWEEYAEIAANKQGLGLLSRDNNLALLKLGGQRAEQFWLRWVLPAQAKGKIAGVILYSGKSTEQKAIEEALEFESSLKEYHNNTYKMVNNSLSGSTVDRPALRPWKIHGVIPQVDNDYQNGLFQNNELVPFSEYVKKDNISTGLKIVA